MASKTTKGRKNTRSKKKTRTKAKSSNAKNTELAGEITILVILTVCILLVLSNFGIGGIAGEAVSSVLFGLFGYMAYVLPFLVFAAAAFFISNRGNTHAYIKIAAGVFLFLFLTAILELIFNSYTPGTKLISYYTAASEHHNAGGLTGGCMISMLCPLIGKIGTYVVLVVLSVICIILITEKSLLAPIGRKSKRAYEDVRRKRQETAVLRAKQKEESKTLSESRKSGQSLKKEENEPEKRIDHKVSGVSFATTLMSEAEIPKKGRRKNKSPDVCELIPDNEAFVINREEPFMEAEPIRQEGKEQQYEALQQTDTFTPLEEKAE